MVFAGEEREILDQETKPKESSAEQTASADSSPLCSHHLSPDDHCLVESLVIAPWQSGIRDLVQTVLWTSGLVDTDSPFLIVHTERIRS